MVPLEADIRSQAKTFGDSGAEPFKQDIGYVD
jgi:hypothetical protein